MWVLIVGLLIVGATLLIIEAFVPGMIVGICGLIALVAAGILAFLHYGSPGASLVLLTILVGGTVLLIWWLRYAPRSFVARKWSLHDSVPNGPDPTSLDGLLNTQGEAITSLRPSGVANLAGRRTDVVTRGEMIDQGQPVEVVSVEGRRVVVRQLPRYDGAD